MMPPMESVFYKYGHKKRIPVSYLFLELLSKSVENSDSNEDLRHVLEPVLSSLGVNPPYSDELLLEITEDLKEVQEAKVSSSPPAPKPSSSRDRRFGEEFVGWFRGLNIDVSLYLLTHYDFQKACDLYCHTPVLVVDKMLTTKFEHEWNSLEAGFESVVLGMGGKIKKSSAAAKETFAIPKDEVEEQKRNQQLKKLGF
jgi:hypothetical protein